MNKNHSSLQFLSAFPFKSVLHAIFKDTVMTEYMLQAPLLYHAQVASTPRLIRNTTAVVYNSCSEIWESPFSTTIEASSYSVLLA